MLIIGGGPEDGSTIVLEKPTISMGGLPKNDIVVNEPGVSREHAEIVHTDDGYCVRDHSTNGTFVNGDDIRPEDLLLRDGDEIRLATAEVSFTFRDFAASTLQMTVTQPSIMAVPTEAPEEEEDTELYEGSVRLKVVAEGDIQQVVHFVQELRQQTQLRVLRLVGNSQKDLDILLGLREPLHLREVLGEMAGVSQVDQIEDGSEGGGGLEQAQEESEGTSRALSVRLSGGGGSK